MSIETKEKDTRTYWSDCEQVFFTCGKGYGLTEQLSTICLGSEDEVKKALDTGGLTGEFTLVQRQVLMGILEYRKELSSEQSGAIIKRPGAVRSRPSGTVKRRKANLRHHQVRKRVALHSP